MTIPPIEILAKARSKNTGKGKGKHVDVVETEQLQPSETASTVSYPSQYPSVVGELSCISSVDPVDRGCVTQFRVYPQGDKLVPSICFLTVAHSYNACPLTYPGQKIPFLDLGIHTASGARLQHDGG